MACVAACKRAREDDALGGAVDEAAIVGAAVDAVIARGSYGTVHRVWRPAPGGEGGAAAYAEKRYARHETAGVLTADYLVELAALATLPPHAHVISLVASPSPPDGRLLMPCARGTLARYMRARQPTGAVAAWCEELSAALGHLHAHGVVHRDVKPSTVLVFREGRRHRLRLSDFGAAAVLLTDRAAMHDAALTTIAYAAPELLRGEAYDAAVDAWGLGMIAAELALGRLCLLRACRTRAEVLAAVEAADGAVAEARAALRGEWRRLLSADPAARGRPPARPAAPLPRDTTERWGAAARRDLRDPTVRWMGRAAAALRLCERTTLPNATALFDLTMAYAAAPPRGPRLRALACACVQVAGALVERCNIEADEFVHLTAGTVTPATFGEMQRLVLAHVPAQELARLRCAPAEEGEG